MTIETYVTKHPETLDVVEWTGDNVQEIADFTGCEYRIPEPPTAPDAPTVVPTLYLNVPVNNDSAPERAVYTGQCVTRNGGIYSRGTLESGWLPEGKPE